MIAAAGIARMESMTEAERKALIEKISFGVRPRWPLEMLPKAALPELILDMNRVFTEDDPDDSELTFLTKLH